MAINNTLKSTLILFCLMMLLSACDGPPNLDVKISNGSSSSFMSHSSSSSESSSALSYRSAGDYPSIPGCTPFEGNETGSFKVVFINHNNNDNFDIIINSAIENEFYKLLPYSNYKEHMAFYKISLNGEYKCEAHSGSLSGGFSCDQEKVNKELQRKCDIDDKDISGIIKVFITKINTGGSASDVIFIGDTMLGVRPNTIIHELSHNLGLADLYSNGSGYDEAPVVVWSADFSRRFSNVDGPGCPKWCNTFKPASEYTQSSNAICSTFRTKNECLSFNRDNQGYCEWNTTEERFDCCVWDSTKSDDYFKTSCLPVWGTENIGLDCLEGTGCYYGASYGNVGWRPSKYFSEDIMASLSAEKFSNLSIRELDKVLSCCASPLDSSEGCKDFRKAISDFMYKFSFKEAFGSCQVLSQ